jgi:hypothetical protein
LWLGKHGVGGATREQFINAREEKRSVLRPEEAAFVLIDSVKAGRGNGKKSGEGCDSSRLKAGLDFLGLMAWLNRLRKKWHCRLRAPSAAKAGIDFAALTARLKAAPFQNTVKTGVFPQASDAVPFRNPLSALCLPRSFEPVPTV